MALMRSVLLLLLAATPLAYGDSFQLFQNVFGRRALPLAQQVEQKLLGSNKWTPPPFCHGLECPRYELLNKSDIYEARRYEAGTWAATTVEGLVYSASQVQGFKRLFSYIQGENEDSTKIEMTAPVLTAVQPGQGPFCKSNFTVNFYMEERFQSDPPTPSSPLVSIKTYPKEVVYVHSFGGFLVDDLTLAAKVKTLKTALAADNLKFNEEFFYTASYDPPFRVTGRHNEVMVTAVVA